MQPHLTRPGESTLPVIVNTCTAIAENSSSLTLAQAFSLNDDLARVKHVQSLARKADHSLCFVKHLWLLTVSTRLVWRVHLSDVCLQACHITIVHLAAHGSSHMADWRAPSEACGFARALRIFVGQGHRHEGRLLAKTCHHTGSMRIQVFALLKLSYIACQTQDVVLRLSWWPNPLAGWDRFLCAMRMLCAESSSGFSRTPDANSLQHSHFELRSLQPPPGYCNCRSLVSCHETMINEFFSNWHLQVPLLSWYCLHAPPWVISHVLLPEKQH